MNDSGNRTMHAGAKRPGRTPISFRLARALAFVWRFHHLQLVKRLQRGRGGTTLLARRFFDSQILLDVNRSTTHGLLYLDGEEFIDERQLFTGLLRDGMTVVDVGANIGYYALMARHYVGAGGRIFCFEPEPTNAAELRRNVSENSLSNVTVVEAAVGNEPGSARLWSGLNGSVVDGGGDIEVPVVTLDSAVAVPAHLVKVDVEGFEASVLKGAERLIRSHRPILFVEMHPRLVPTPTTIEEIITFVRQYYQDVRYYHLPIPTSVDKVRQRYFGGDPVREVDDLGFLLANSAGNSYGGTFWMVCRPGSLSRPPA